MQFNRIKFSLRSQHIYGQIKHRTDLGINVIARYGLCLSLKDFSIPNPEEYDERGMEILPGVLFGEHENIYNALMIDRLKKDGLDPEKYFHIMTRAHICRGANALSPRVRDLSDFSDLIQMELA